MSLPKVRFTADPEVSALYASFFLAEPNAFNEYAEKMIFRDHPRLKKILSKTPESKKVRTIKDYIHKYCKENENRIKLALEEQKSAWNEVGDKVLATLASIFNTDWEGISELTWDVGVIQMYPRDLDENLFQTYYEQYTFQALPMALHELTHFIYFKKWRELFPNDAEDTFEAPHQFWFLSELMDPIINAEERLRLLIPDAEIYHDPMYHTNPLDEKNKNITIHGYFTQKYLEYKQDGKTIEDFLTFAREKIQEINFQGFAD